MTTQWILAAGDEAAEAADFWKEVCDLPCIIRLISRKGFADRDGVESFLRPRLSALSDPFLLPEMRAAVERILAAIDRRERIVLFGDYDVDGVTSLALLHEMLSAYGAAPQLFLPSRMEEGYGLSRDGLERCRRLHDPQLLVAVDCGTSSTEEIAELKAAGIDVIVLDHHEPKAALPDCVAVVNPKTAKAGGLDYFCSVGIVFKVCHALLKTRPVPGFELKQHLDLVALGTVSDIVPLLGENRILVQHGARQIAQSRKPGLRKLMTAAVVRPPILAEHIGFRLGPRLNAAGRLSTAEKALQLLLTRDETEATELAEFLDIQNRERQSVEREIFKAAEEQVEREFSADQHAAIVLGARGWHQGVLGIVASRIARKHHRPAIVIGFDESGVGKGSGRSIEGLSLVAALTDCAKWLEKYGGHEMAAGLTITEKNFAAFAEAFRDVCRARLSDGDLQPRLHLDHELTFSEVNFDLLRWHEILQPFGSGNAQPLFLARAVQPAAPPQIVKERHLVLRLKQHNQWQRAIFFGGAESPLPEPPWDIAFRIGSDEYEGETRLQMQVQAIRAAAPLA